MLRVAGIGGGGDYEYEMLLQQYCKENADDYQFCSTPRYKNSLTLDDLLLFSYRATGNQTTLPRLATVLGITEISIQRLNKWLIRKILEHMFSSKLILADI